MLIPGKVLSGKYFGNWITEENGTIKIGGSENVLNDIKSVTVVGSINKADLIFSVTPVKTYYNVQVTWYSGGESIMGVNGKVLNVLNSRASANAKWRAMTPAQRAETKRKAAAKDEEESRRMIIGIIIVVVVSILMTLPIWFAD